VEVFPLEVSALEVVEESPIRTKIQSEDNPLSNPSQTWIRPHLFSLQMECGLLKLSNS